LQYNKVSSFKLFFTRKLSLFTEFRETYQKQQKSKDLEKMNYCSIIVERYFLVVHQIELRLI
jgi:hypothetical protein